MRDWKLRVIVREEAGLQQARQVVDVGEVVGVSALVVGGDNGRILRNYRFAAFP
jgi:hypothetical protein